jgi:carotenoid cleavage dioxygenase
MPPTPIGRVLSRRDVLHLVGAGVIGAAMAPALVACGSNGGSTGASTTALGATGRPAVDDPTRPYWLQGNFTPVYDEVHMTDLSVEGTLPSELDGLFVRNGSNPATGTSPHWFLGDGMVHGVRIESGQARWYANRYVETPYYLEGRDFNSGGAPGNASNQSNVSTFMHGGRLLTSGEVGFPYELSTADLSTKGVYDFGGQLSTAMTAHPKIDPTTGEMHFFGYGFVPPYLTYHVVSTDGVLRHSEEVSIPNPVMMHDFAITDRDVIFWDFPVVFDMEAAVAMVSGKSEGFPFRWEPALGARLGVMPLGGPASEIRWVEIEPCFVFHGVNAFRNGDDVVLDVSRLPFVFADGTNIGTTSIRRWTINTSGPSLTFRDEMLSDVHMDLPAIDRRFVGRPYENGWFAVTDDRGGDAFDFAGLYRLEPATGVIDRWDPGPQFGAGEGVFVPRGAAEGDGWLITFVYDRGRDGSDFVVFDAEDMAGGPVGRVALPRRVPYGFHGWWVDASLT